MGRTFNQLKKQKNQEELDRFAKAVTEQYAASGPEHSQRTIAEYNNLTKQSLRDLMDYAIITELVSIETSDKVKYKAVLNQQNKAEETGSNSIRHHRDLMRRRERHRINRIATDMAEHLSEPLSHFTEKYNLESDRETGNLLVRSITEDIVSDEIMEKLIKERGKKSEEYFENLRSMRAAYKEANLIAEKAKRAKKKKDSQ